MATELDLRNIRMNLQKTRELATSCSGKRVARSASAISLTAMVHSCNQEGFSVVAISVWMELYTSSHLYVNTCYRVSDGEKAGINTTPQILMITSRTRRRHQSWLTRDSVVLVLAVHRHRSILDTVGASLVDWLPDSRNPTIPSYHEIDIRVP